MKLTFIIVISFYFCENTIAQTILEGDFKLNYSEAFYTPEVDEFIFLKDQKIELIRYTDLGTCFGYGIYSITNNKFAIKFDSIPASIKDTL